MIMIMIMHVIIIIIIIKIIVIVKNILKFQITKGNELRRVNEN